MPTNSNFNVSFPRKRWTEEVYAALVSRVQAGPGLACFDFDNTLIHNDFGEKMMEAVLQEGMAHVGSDLSEFFRDSEAWADHTKLSPEQKERALWEEYSYQLKEYGIERGYRWTAFIFEGLSVSDFYKLSQKAWAEVQKRPGHKAVYPQPEMRDLIAFLDQSGWESWIVTASPEIGVQAIADAFPIREDRVVGMRVQKDDHGRNTRKILEPYTYGQGKVLAIQSRIGKIPDFAFGDSFNDFPMLCYAKLGVAMDRGNPDFVTACQAKEILIQPFFSYTNA